MKNIKENRFFRSTTTIFGLMLMAILAVGSCTDRELMDNSQRDGNGSSVRFNVIDGQQTALEQMQNAFTRGGYFSPAFKKFIPQEHKVIGPAEFANTCLLETTVEGVNPVMYGAATRGKIKSAIDSDFGVLAYTGMTEQGISKTPNYLYNAQSDKSGKLYTPKSWPQNHKYGIFYGIFPYTENKATDKIHLSEATYEGVPYVNFTVEDEITKQVGLSTACSGIVQDNLPNEGPTANLTFRPVLTAIRFAVGQNLSWNKVIDRLEIRNAYSKGRYTLSDKADGTGGKWSNLSDKKNFVLDGINVSTKENPNTIIIGKDDDDYAFLMVPQMLTGKNVEVRIHFTDGTEVKVPLTGEWEPGVTKTYKLSRLQSNWEYVLTASSPATIDYKTSVTGNYGITSYRQAPDGTQQPVAWEVVGYDGNNDGNYTMTQEDRAWLISLSKTEGTGGMFEEKGQATVNNIGAIINLLEQRNNNLRNAPRKGNIGKEYDLSTHLADGTKTAMTTANCYVISAPGYYKLPLVFGNAMVKGRPNESSYRYTSSKPYDQYVMYRFQNHMGNPINSPYICGVKHARTNLFEFKPTGAKLIWADGESLVKNLRIIGSGKKSYLAFEVTKDDIKHGNAVVAALGKLITPSGLREERVLWSWHLWFTESDVLKPIEVSDHDYMKHGFTTEDLGWKYTQWRGTSYKERSIKVKVMQKVGNQPKQTAIITISQTGGTTASEGYSTHYQWGRKEAFPGTESLSSQSMSIATGGNGVFQSAALQHPATFYVGISANPDWSYCHYKNLWSAANEDHGYSAAPVVKTIYDPSPVGFHVPSSSAFTGFTTSGKEESAPAGIKVDGEWNNGWSFVGISRFSPAYFPAAGHRGSHDNKLYKNKVAGYYWTAIPSSLYQAISLYLDQNKVNPVHSAFHRANAFSIRPETDN